MLSGTSRRSTYGCEKIKLAKRDNICIFGGDFNGLLMIQFARLFGVNEITVVEPKKQAESLLINLVQTM